MLCICCLSTLNLGYCGRRDGSARACDRWGDRRAAAKGTEGKPHLGRKSRYFIFFLTSTQTSHSHIYCLYSASLEAAFSTYLIQPLANFVFLTYIKHRTGVGGRRGKAAFWAIYFKQPFSAETSINERPLFDYSEWKILKFIRLLTMFSICCRVRNK